MAGKVLIEQWHCSHWAGLVLLFVMLTKYFKIRYHELFLYSSILKISPTISCMGRTSVCGVFPFILSRKVVGSDTLWI